ncbi:centromere protein J [Chelonus insularis]|uniref:centromere protein J n=1 Tax=Chelonus insularis TaxID=460826 RepID=UPI00158BE64A|nr:centromere protein J [Chelonus insularis]
MTSEESLIKKLDELRKWQMQRQTLLTQFQQEQREKLSTEQKQIYETLGLSLDNITDNESLVEKLAMLQLSISTDDDTDSPKAKPCNYTNTQNPANFDKHEIIVKKEPNPQMVSSDDTDEFNTSLNSSCEVLNKINYNHKELSIQETPKKYQDTSSTELNGVHSLSLTPGKCIDDIPVPSPKKDFQTLLEEKLKDSGAIKTNNNNDNNKVTNGIKRPFLRKGTGLARFRMGSKTDKNSANMKNSKLQNTPLSTKLKVTKVQKNSSTHCAAKQKKNTETRRRTIHGISPRSTTIPKIPQQKLNLRNVSLPQKVLQRRSLPAVLVKSPEPDKISITSNDQSEIDELDTSRLETKIFEMLEERAENSSFCSNSSAVIDFLRQSTPIKLRNIRKNLQSLKNSGKTDTNIPNNNSNKIIHSKNSSSDKNTRCLTNENQMLKDIDALKIIQKSLTAECLHNVGNQMIKSSKYQDYADIDDTKCVLSTKKAESCDLIKNDYHESDKNADADISVHVRFADYNEYKSISDISVLSKDSYDYDDKISSNHSTSAESDTDTSTDKPEIVELEDLSDSEQSSGSKKSSNSIPSNKKFAEAFDNQSTDNEHSRSDDPDDSDFDNTILEFQEPIQKVSRWSSSEIMTECNEKMKAHHTDIHELKQDRILDDDDTILKSELLKSRLLELEREIEIFRKENSALMAYRQKLNNEQNRLRKEYEEKHKDLKMEKIHMKNSLEEEKKRVIREKAALENRLRDAREKSLQTKQERLEIQNLKEKLEKLQDDMNDKENRWQAAQARQRSQIRVLQMENTKLKEEVARLQAARKNNSRLRKPMAISNTKAIHEINRQLDNYRNSIEQNEDDIKKEEKKSKLPVKSHPEKIESTSNHQITKSTSTEEEKVTYDQSTQVIGNRENNSENTLQKRYLYESLLKDATNEYVINYNSQEQQTTHNEDVENRNSNSLIQMNDKETKIQINDGLKNYQFDTIKNYQNSLTRNSVHNDDKVALNEKSSSSSPKIVQKSYKQFVQEVINTKNDEANTGHQYSQRTLILRENSPKKQSIQTISTSDLDKNSTGRSNQLVEHNSPRQLPMMSYGNNITNSQNGLSELRDMDSDLNPRREIQKPIPRPTENTVPKPECNHISQISESHIDNKCALPTAQQNIREVKHPDGHIEFWYSNGNVKRVYPDRNISKMIYYNGDVCETAADGCVKYFYAATKTWQTTYPDGFEILEFPDGQQERRTTDGVVEVSFPDGSVRLIQPDGIEKWALSDGTIAEIFPNGDKILSFSNGQREIHTSDHKRREYPDGTVKFIYLDGTQETRYSNGRVRMKDKDGNLIMDSY